MSKDNADEEMTSPTLVCSDCGALVDFPLHVVPAPDRWFIDHMDPQMHRLRWQYDPGNAPQPFRIKTPTTPEEIAENKRILEEMGFQQLQGSTLPMEDETIRIWEEEL